MPVTLGFEPQPRAPGSVELTPQMTTEETHTLLSSRYNYSDASLGGQQTAGLNKIEDVEDGDLAEAGLMSAEHAAGLKKEKIKWLLYPNTTFVKAWDVARLVTSLYICWVVPVRVGFDHPAIGFWFWLEGFINLFFLADIFVNFCTAYEHPATGELITDHKRIATRYLKSWFIIDFLATLPVDYIAKAVEGTFVCSAMGSCYNVVPNPTSLTTIMLIKSLRIFRIIWIFKNFKVISLSTVVGRYRDELYLARWLSTLLELLILLIFLGHLTACFFYMFSHPRWQTPAEQDLIAEGELSNWIMDKFGAYNEIEIPDPYTGVVPPPSPIDDSIGQDPITKKWYECPKYFTMVSCPQCNSPGPYLRCESAFSFSFRYITALYWAYTTMTTVGYGDIAGVTIAEKIWCICTMVLGGFFLSFCFGRMASQITKLDADASARAERLEQVTQFLRDVELPRPLHRKVVEYFKSSTKTTKAYDRQAVLGALPIDLRVRILEQLYHDTIRAVPILQKMLGDEVFLNDLCFRLQPCHVSPETFLYRRGEATADVFILLRGDVHIMGADKTTYLFKIPQGTLFGEGCILRIIDGTSKPKRSENVYCASACEMLKVTQEDMQYLCDHYPDLLSALRKLDHARQLRIGAKYRTVGRPNAMPAGPESSLMQLPFSGGSVTVGSEPMLPEMLESGPSFAQLHGGSTGDLAGHLRHGSINGDPHNADLTAEVEALKHIVQEQQHRLEQVLQAHKTLLEQLPELIAQRLQPSSSS